jgi:flagellar M-ring protein FliF
MNQLRNIIAGLSWRQRTSILIAAALVGGGLFGLARWRRESDFRPLFSALAPEDAGAVVERLKGTGVQYRVAENGGTILVPSAKVAELRLDLAVAGLPKTGRIGFELFDKTNLGATDFTEHVNYRRALEGELERSAMALVEVEQARVHLTFAKDSVFLESKQPAKASVLLRLKPGARLAPNNVIAIAHLVASAVEGLSPEAVSIVDMQGNLLNRPRRETAADGSEPADSLIEYRQKLERDLLGKIDSTLEPLLGSEKFRAGISVDCDFTSGEQSEESFDPSRSVMVSSQKTEDSSTSAMSGGVPGTASNLPRPTGRAAGGGSGSSRSTESISYQSSRTVRKLRLPQGTVKRMSISVLVDSAVRWEGQGSQLKKVLVPQSPERLKAVHDLVAAVSGLSPDRGDQLVVESLPFEATLNLEAPLASPVSHEPAPVPGTKKLTLKDPKILGGAAAAILLLLTTVFWLARRSGRVRPQVRTELPQALPPASPNASVSGSAKQEPAPVQNSAREKMQAQLQERDTLQEQLNVDVLNGLKVPAVSTQKAEVLSSHLRQTVSKDATACVKVLQSWLHEDRMAQTFSGSHDPS